MNNKSFLSRLFIINQKIYNFEDTKKLPSVIFNVRIKIVDNFLLMKYQITTIN